MLWSVVLLALLATQITAAGRSELQLTANVEEAAAAEAAADAGVFAAIFHVLDPATPWDADGRTHAEAVGRFRLAVEIVDEDSKVNPNLAPQPLLAALFSAVGADGQTAQTVATAILQWHGPGVAPQTLQQYRAAGRSLLPNGRPFRSVDQLGLVLGMTPELLARVRPFVSVYTDGNVNYERADPLLQAVLRALAGAPPAAPGIQPPPTVATITSSAVGRRGGRFTRRATISFGEDSSGQLYRIVAWDAGQAAS